MKKRNLFSPILFAGILLLVLSWALGLFGMGKDDLSYSEIVNLFQKEQVKSFVVQDQQIQLELHAPYEGETSLTCDLADPDRFREELWTLIQSQSQNGILESYDFVPEEKNVRMGSADITGKLCVIGAQLDEAAIAALFGA